MLSRIATTAVRALGPSGLARPEVVLVGARALRCGTPARRAPLGSPLEETRPPVSAEKPPPKVLVTGALGQLGPPVVAELRRRYGRDRVVASDVVTPPVVTDDVSPFVELNACRLDEVDDVVRRDAIDTVVHLAAARVADPDDRRVLHVTARSVETILEAARAHDVRVLLASSMAVYGSTAKGHETEVPEPDTAYGVAKVYGELLGTYYRDRYAVDFRALRLPGVVSPRGAYVGANDWAVEVFQDALKRGHFKCSVAPTTSLPLIYVDDLVRGLADFLDTDDARLTRRVYNMGGFDATPAALAEAIDRDFPFSIHYTLEDGIHHASWPERLNDTYARRDWGWRPRFGVAETTHAMLSAIAYDMRNGDDDEPVCNHTA